MLGDQGAGPYPEGVVGTVLRHARLRPGGEALGDGREPITYGQLASQVARAAAGLRALGVDRGDRVVLRLGNSPSFVTTALACLWVGAIFVPLDPNAPLARQQHIIADCAPKLVVCPDEETAAPYRPTWTAVCCAELAAAVGEPPGYLPDTSRDAYIIYTSGTTGTPKGVTVSEQALLWSTTQTINALGLTCATRALAVSSFHFDGSYAGLFPTLVAGGLMVVPPRQEMLLIRGFCDLLVASRINLTSFSPSYLRLLVNSRYLARLAGSTLRWLLVGGERCVAKDVQRLWQVLPGVAVYNRYGPTETTVAVTTHRVTPEDIASDEVPLGHPHPGVEFVVVDHDGSIAVGPDVEGELWVGGRQLMTGYWGDPALTRKVMRDDLVGHTLYKTGDLVRRAADGQYYYRGRLDDVIKRNGVRISLSEVASAMAKSQGVIAATCALYDSEGHPGIAAFAQSELDLPVLGIVRQAGEAIPANSLPDRVFVVKHFPITTQGKVDQRELLRDVGLQPWGH